MNKLFELQSKIDEINSQILNLIIKRNQIVKKIGEYKKQKNLPIFDSRRERDIHKKVEISAKKKGLDRRFVGKLFDLILTQSKTEEKNV